MGTLASLHHLSDWALLVLRLGLGTVFLVHGIQKRAMWKMQPSAQMPARLLTIIKVLSIAEPLSELGSGVMATVYLAEERKHHRKVAVKVLRPELAATLGAERFTREIETAAAFHHPNILPLLDSGHAGGFLYYVMPYVEGESLRERLARHGELPIHDAVKIL